MAYFPKIGPFYDPKNEQEFYGEQDGSLRLRNARERRDSGNGSSFRRSSSNTSHAEKDGNVGWTDLVQDQGNLFYMEPSRQPDPRLQHPAGVRVLNSNHTHQHSNDRSDKSDSPRQLIPVENNGINNDSHQHEDLNSSGSSYAVLNRRQYFNEDVRSGQGTADHVPQVQFRREDAQRQSDGSSQSDQSYTSFSKFLDSNTGPPRTSQRNDSFRKMNGQRVSQMNVSQSGKRKSIFMVPTLNNVDDVMNCNGVTLCELLFGIKLCHYKQKSRPNGTNIDQVLRDRKVIVQGVLPDTQADICGQIHRGDMLVCLNEADVTWVNIDDLFRHIAQQEKVKLTFQVPLVVGPKQPTPPVTPTRCTPPPHIPLPSSHHLPPSHPHSTAHHTPHNHKAPPIPPHIPLRAAPSAAPSPSTPPPRPCAPPRWRSPDQDLVLMTTGETLASLGDMMKRYLFAIMYLTLAGQSEDSKADVLYQYPSSDNKATEIRGLFLTLGRLVPDITNNCPTITSVVYRGHQTNVAYWRNEHDMLLICLPESHVPKPYLRHVMADLVQLILVLYGDVMRVFRDRNLHEDLDQLLGLTVWRLLGGAGLAPGLASTTSPLEPALRDSMGGVNWLRLARDDKMSCDEILSEYEAQDYLELEEIDPDKRRSFGIVGSCVYYKDYLLCSHLCPAALRDVHLYLAHHCLLHLSRRQPIEELVIWREFYPTHLCHRPRGAPDNPGYREPRGRWFILVVGMRHFLHCTLLEMGSYASLAEGKRTTVDSFLLEQSRSTLGQLDVDDTEMELRCNERLYTEMIGPRLRAVQPDRHTNRQGSVGDVVSPLKAPGKPDASPRHNMDESDHMSVHSKDGPGMKRQDMDESDHMSVHSKDGPGMKRQGSRISYESNDSSGSNSGISALKLKSASKKGSMHDVTTLNRSFSEAGLRTGELKLTRGCDNLLFHYASFDSFEGLYVSPTPCELTSVQGTVHEHILYNFYGCCLRLHTTFERYLGKERLKPEETETHRVIEEAVMFTCLVNSQLDSKRAPTALMYWVIGRLYPDNREMYVCLEDGAPQSMLELAFRFGFGIS